MRAHSCTSASPGSRSVIPDAPAVFAAWLILPPRLSSRESGPVYAWSRGTVNRCPRTGAVPPADEEGKPRRARAHWCRTHCPMRSSGLEPPRGKLPTRPSTLRVYQFRHERRVREYSPARPSEIVCSGGAASSEIELAYEGGLANGPRSLHPSTAAATVRTGVRFRTSSTRTGSRAEMDLTKRQQEIFDFIRKYSAKYGYPPTVRDIGKAVGLASSSTVHAHLANLEKLGLLRRDPSKPRAIELLDRAMGGAVETVRGLVRSDGLPLLGAVAAEERKS